MKNKKPFFIVITLLIPVFFFILLEISLRSFDYGDNLELFIPASEPYSDYKKINPVVSKRFFSRQSTLPIPSNDVFLADKPDNGYRIFVMGGSTALGFPYGNIMMFSRILNRRMEDSFPEKRIEVVNVALTAANSYTLLDFIDEILSEKPDAILIYAGHNEYYGALGVTSLESISQHRELVLTYLYLNKFKTFTLLRSAITGIKNIIGDALFGEKNIPTGTLMERLAIDQQIEENSNLFKRGNEQFEQNLRSVLSKIEQSSVPVLISDLVSNVRDLKPFGSAEKDSSENAAHIFSEARRLEENGQYEMAKQTYYRAKDLDVIRFRAHENINHIIYRLSDEFALPVVPMKIYFEEASINSLIGSNLIVDHLHPNIDGYFLMAEAFYQSMRKYHFVADRWDSLYVVTSNEYKDNWPLTALDSTIAALMLQQLKAGWPFQPMSGENRILLDYKAQSIIESLALKVIFDQISVDQAHLLLAQHYDQANEHQLATREYDALSYLVFIEAYSYLNRARAFLRAKKDKQALEMLQESLKREKILLAERLVNEINLRLEESKN
jgi:lysophospholipase L1-like esterase